MNEFNAEDYFDRRAYNDANTVPVGSSTGLTKRQEVEQASKRKVALLEEARTTYQETLSAKMGLDKGSITSDFTNFMAGGYAGLSNTVVGPVVAAAGGGISGNIDISSADPESTAAYNRLQQGKATPQDKALLNALPTRATGSYGPDGTFMPDGGFSMPENNGTVRANQRTNLQLLQDGIKKVETARNISESFNRDSLVIQDQKNALGEDLKSGFAAPWEQYKKGGEQVYNDGNLLEGGANIVAGMAKLIYNAGDAALSNKQGVLQYAAENAPQLLLGLVGKSGALLQGATNAGYALDTYNQGIQNHVAKFNALPSEEQRQTMAYQAATLALAEQAGDMVGISAIGRGGKEAAKGLEKATARESFLNAMKRTGVAAVDGGAGETLTEGYQTYTEGEITGKPASAADIYVGGVIGGLSGGVLSGGGRGVNEALAAATGNSVEQQDYKKRLVVDRANFEAAVTANDPSPYLNPENSNYSPLKAVGVLHKAAAAEGATPELKQANLEQASTILGEMQTEIADGRNALREAAKLTPEAVAANVEQIAAIKDAISKIDPAQTDKIAELTSMASQIEEVNTLANPKAAKVRSAELDVLERDINEVRALKGDLAGNAALPAQEVSNAIAEANITVDQADTVAVAKHKESVDKVINLSMTNTASLTASEAKTLATNTKNSLTTEQREYFRVFSAARIAENALKSLGDVAAEVMVGNKKTDQKGIETYRSEITNALNYANKQAVTDKMALLTNFAVTREAKAAAAVKAYEEVKAKGTGAIQLMLNEAGAWTRVYGKSDLELKENGGMSISKGSPIVGQVKAEAKAVRLSLQEMKSLVALKQAITPITTNVTNTKAGTQTSPSTQQTNTTTATETPTVVGSDATTTGLPPTGNTQLEGNGVSVSPVAQTTAAPTSVAPVSELTATPAEYGEAVRVSKSSNEADLDNASERILQLVQAINEGTEIKVVSAKENQSKVADTTEAPSEGVAAATGANVGEATTVNQPKKESNAETTETQQAGSQQQEEKANDVNQGLNALANPSPEEAAYREKNLLASYFTQAKGKLSDLTKQPLVTVKDFLTAVKNEVVKITDFITTTEDKPSEAELTALRSFYKHAKSWNSKFQEAFKDKKRAEFRYENLMTFLFENTDGFVDTEENVKTAMSVGIYTWLVENAGKPPYNSDEDINRILGRDKETLVSSEERAILISAGMRENTIRNDLGKRAIQALGLTPKPDAKENLLPQLESAIGAYMLKLMLDEKYVVRNAVSGENMAALTGSSDTNTAATFNFIKVSRDEERNLDPRIEALVVANKGSQSVINRLFEVESSNKEPSLSPIPFKQRFTKGTKQAIPKRLQKILEEKNAEANYVRQDMLQLMGQLDEKTMLEMAGFVETKGKHISGVEGIQAKNDGLTRELRNFMGFVGGMVDNTVAMYFEHSVWKQQRVGIATNVINPQSSKIHRFMLFRKAWETKVEINDDAQMENFQLRVAEGLGIKTDKQFKQAALAEFAAKVALPEIVQAVSILRKAIFQGGITAEEQAALAQGVKMGGEKFHSLDALVALAHYAEAKATEGKTDFTVQMMGEIDGVTNGPILSHLLLGAAASVKDLFGLLNKGGFYQLGSPYSQYNNFRGTAGNTDLYEGTTLNVTRLTDNFARNGIVSSRNKRIMSAQKANDVLGAIYYVTGSLVTDAGTKVTKAGRNIIKTPLTAMLFGSSLTKAVDNMANNFIDAIYEKIEKLNEEGKPSTELITQLNKILTTKLSTKLTTEQLMDVVFTNNTVEELKKGFNLTIGIAVKETMKTDFADFLEARKTITATTKLIFELYNASYTAMKEQLIKELIEKKEIEVDKNGTPVHGLSTEQEQELRKRVDAIAPKIHSALSKKEGNLDAGLNMAKTARQISQESTYESEVSFATPIEGSGTSSMKTRGNQTVLQEPGAMAMPVLTHSSDSAISHLASEGNEVLNVHDAHGSGLGNFAQTARNLNQATWETMLNYSPATEVFQALERTVAGLTALLEDKNTPETVKQNVIKALEKIAGKEESDPSLVIRFAFSDALNLSMTADRIKLEALSQLAYIDQYALEGGNYEVTTEDRQKASDMLANVPQDITEQQKESLTKLSDLLGFVSKAPAAAVPLKESERVSTKENPLGVIGTPVLASDPELIRLLAAKPVMTGRELLALLGPMLKSKGGKGNLVINQMLGMLDKAMTAGITVRYVTKDTNPALLLGRGGNSNRGWYVSKGSKDEIYILGNEFRSSGVTTELLAHEIFHAALALTIEKEYAALAKDQTYTSEALELIKDLEVLFKKAQAHTIKNGTTSQYASALTNIHEFVSWGMTNKDFQDNVLSMITMRSATKQNSLLTTTGMKAFIKNIVGILFKDAAKSSQAIAVDGMALLVANVSGLLAYAGQSNKQNSDVTLNMTGPTPAMQYTTGQLFEALADPGMDPSFKTHLEGVLTRIVERLHGPFGSFKTMMGPNQPMFPLDVFQKALDTGIAPFASAALGANLKFNNQTAFVMEQVEATMRAAMASKNAEAHNAYRALRGLFLEQKNRLTPADFNIGPWANATAAERQEIYDFIFKIDDTKGKKEDYLARFAALGLTHPEFYKMLQVPTKRVSDTKTDGTVTGFLKQVFEKVLEFFNGKLTNTEAGMRADKELQALVEQLIAIENRRKSRLVDTSSGVFDALQESLDKGAQKAKDLLAQAAQTSFIKNNKSAFVKLAGTVATTAATGRTLLLLEGIRKLRDQQFADVHGIATGILNNVLGPGAKPESLSRKTKQLEQRRKFVETETSKGILQSFANQGKDLTEEQKGAITNVFLRTGAHSLLGQFNMAEIEKLIRNPAALKAEIDKAEQQITGVSKDVKNFYLNQSKILAYFLATENNVDQHTLLNASNIVNLEGTGVSNGLSVSTADSMIESVDTYITLLALSYTHTNDRMTLDTVMATEGARGMGINGLQMAMLTHKELEQDAKERVFSNSDVLMRKGYVPDVFNPHTDIKAATALEGEDLVNRGYIKSYPLMKDPADPSPDTKYLYVLRDGAEQPWNSGALSLTSMKARGSEIAVKTKDEAAFKRTKDIAINALFKARPNFDPAVVDKHFSLPVLNPDGQVTAYNYVMKALAKDTILERNSGMDKVLGVTASGTFDKANSTEQNKTVIDAMHQQYKDDYAANPTDYVNVGLKSNDPDMRDLFRMLPYETRQHIENVWGREGMMIQKSLVDVYFGYRKLSLSTLFDKQNKNMAENAFTTAVEFALTTYARHKLHMSTADSEKYARRAGVYVARSEHVIQEIVKEVKANFVVRSIGTISNNIFSNLTLLSLHGVPLLFNLKYTQIALAGARDYRRDSNRLFFLENQLKSGYLTGSVNNITDEIELLKESLASNPVKPLMDEGLMPTIVEDFVEDDDRYSYKSMAVRKIDNYTSKLNPAVLSAAKNVFMTKDTEQYQTMSEITQLSDFVARFVLYQYLTTKKNPIGHKEAIQEASESFINYDLPMQRVLQYTDDMGITMFTKYFLNIQRVLAKRMKEAPGKVMMMVVAQNYLSGFDTVVNSSVFEHFGNNPVGVGPLNYPQSLGNIPAINATLSLFK